MSFEEFKQTTFALKYREDNLSIQLAFLKEVSKDWPVSQNKSALIKVANDNIDDYLRDIWEHTEG